LIIPRQSIPREEANAGRLKVVVREDDHQPREFDLRPSSVNGTVVTAPLETRLYRPFSSLEVVLRAGRETLRPPWNFAGIGSQDSWMAFDGETGRLIIERPLSQHNIWLLAPETMSLDGGSITGEASVWGDFLARRVDLGTARDWRLEERRNGSKSIAVPFERGAIGRPFLEGTRFCASPPVSCPDCDYVFVGVTPDLIIPIGALGVDGWRGATLAVRSLDDETVEMADWRRVSLADVCGSGNTSDGRIRLHLADPPLSVSTGRHEVRLRGRLGRDETFQIAVIPMDEAVSQVAWAFGRDEGAALRHESKVLDIDLLELENATAPTLSLRVPLDPAPSARLILDGGVQSCDVPLRHGRAVIRLGGFLDTIRAGYGASRTLKLVLTVPDAKGPCVFEAIRIRRRWGCIAQSVETDVDVESGRRCVFLAWRDDVAIRDRVIRLWREDGHPDRHPFEIDVDDGATEVGGEFPLESLPDGRYLVEFGVRSDDGWTRPCCPSPFSEGMEILTLNGASAELLGSPAARLEQLLKAHGSCPSIDVELRDRVVADIVAEPEVALRALRDRGWGGSLARLFASGGFVPEASVRLEDVYCAVSWCIPKAVVRFLQGLGRVCGGLRCNEGEVLGIEFRATEQHPARVRYRAKSQLDPRKNRPPRRRCFGGTIDEAAMSLASAIWYRVQPRDWSPVVERFILTRFQSGLARGVASGTAEVRVRIEELGRQAFLHAPDDYFDALVEADKDLRGWASTTP